MERVLTRCLQLDPDLAIAWQRLGEARWKLGDLAGAERAFTRCCELDPCPGEAWFERGEVLSLQGREPEITH